MSLNIQGKDVPVAISEKLADNCVDVIRKWRPFVDWASNLDPDFNVSRIEIQSLDYFGEKVGFLKFKCDITSKSTGKRVPGIIFMRGGSVAILPIVTIEGDEEKKEYVLLTEQPRVPSCSSRFLEIPAGMLDGDGHFVGVAAKELEEETSITISEESLIDMTKELFEKRRKEAGMDIPTCSRHHTAMLLSPGGSDEFMPVYLFKTQMTKEQLQMITDRIHGVDSEHISVRIVPMDKFPLYVQDAKSLAAYGMYKFLHCPQ